MGEPTIGEMAFDAAVAIYGKDNVDPMYAEKFDLAVANIEDDDTIIAPVGVAEQIAGLDVSWDADSQTVVLSTHSTTS